MSDLLDSLLSESREPCMCAVCEQGRFIKRLQSLLPEAEANELRDWYNAVIDTEENRAMLLYSIETRLAKMQAELKELSLS